jgi:hypothetical protein
VPTVKLKGGTKGWGGGESPPPPPSHTHTDKIINCTVSKPTRLTEVFKSIQPEISTKFHCHSVQDRAQSAQCTPWCIFTHAADNNLIIKIKYQFKLLSKYRHINEQPKNATAKIFHQSKDK